MGNHCDCLDKYDGENYDDSAFLESYRRERNQQAKDRRQSIKEGNHYLDEAAECNLTEFETVFDAILESRKIFRTHHLHPIIMDVVEHTVGARDDFDDRCSFCSCNKGYNFFPKHPNPRTSCYSCKCAHISMLTKKQSLQKYPKLTDAAFIDLRNQNKSVWIRRSKRYRTRDEYFLIDDIENKCVELLGSVEDAKRDKKKRKPKKKKRNLTEMMREMSTTPSVNPYPEPPSKKQKAE